MKDIIKMIIALVFILCSYFLGYYHAEETYSLQLKEVNEKLVVNQSNIKQLTDSIEDLNFVLKKNGAKDINAFAK
jgi:DNA-binding MarR family transcriptional regulator